MGPLGRGFSHQYSIVLFSLPYDFLSDIFFSLVSIVRIHYVTHVTDRISVDQLFVTGELSGQRQARVVGVRGYTGVFSRTGSMSKPRTARGSGTLRIQCRQLVVTLALS